jgi:hypothetical protein
MSLYPTTLVVSFTLIPFHTTYTPNINHGNYIRCPTGGFHRCKLAATSPLDQELTRQINYPEELNRIEDFLTRFVADSSARRRQLPDDDDQEAEEEDQEDADMLADAVDDLDVNGEERSKAKYMRVLRKVANRQSAAVVIDLNDVKEVRYCLTRIIMRVADK